MNDTNSKTLKFKIGEESCPSILTKDDQSNSPFSNTIHKALDCLDGMATTFGEKNTPQDWEYRTRNNIIAFLGDRGTGKTSCMRSAINNCKESHSDWMFLEEIDPSFFDEKHNILEITIGVLYGIFKNDIKDWNKKARKEQDDLRVVQDKFRKVKSALRYLENVKFDDESEIDELLHLNEGSKLRCLLKELVSELLEYHQKKFLVISIDDLDLNIAQSYVMMEHIRKYLIIPNVAIIIAAKYHQLFDSICLVLTNHYKDIEYRVTHKDISVMAERYLNKMFPLDQRFDMPAVESYLDSELIIVDENGNITNADEKASVAVKVPSLIFEKTRYLFYNSADMPSLVIPRNLRDLRMLVSMLYRMKPFEKNASENQKLFKSYFFQEWTGIIAPEYRAFARALISEENPAKINRFVITNLYTFFLKDAIPYGKLNEEIKNKTTDSYFNERKLLRDILNPENSYWNVSIGDVVVILNSVRKIHDSSKITSLIFFIETFYSMKLYESYNALTDSTNENGLVTETEQLTTSPELKATIHGEMPVYFRFVGGSLFSVTGDSFIPSSSVDRDARERRMINGRLLLTEIDRLVKDYSNLSGNNNTKISQSIPQELSARLRLCEFFMLTTRERANPRISFDTSRLANEPLYFHQLGPSTKNLVFDVTSPFVNAIYPKLAYDRFNADIFSIAQKDPESLLNRMTRHHTREKENPTWELMSKATIRNMEILGDLTEWMRNNREKIRPDKKGLQGILQNFYKRYEVNASAGKMPTDGYCVKTYDRYTEGNRKPYYLIDYSIYSLLGDVLKELDENNFSDNDKTSAKERNSIFESIMSYNNIFVLKEFYDKNEVMETLYPYCGHAVVDLAFKNSKEDSLSMNILASILADIRIEHCYDFTDHLPRNLQLSYTEILRHEYDHRIGYLNNDKKQSEESLEFMISERANFTDDKKRLRQAISQYKKLLLKTQETKNKLKANISADRRNMFYYQSLLNDEELMSSEYTRIRKEFEKEMRSLNAHEASMAEAEENIELYDNNINNMTDEIKEKDNIQKDLGIKIKEIKKEIDRITIEITKLEYSKSNPTPVEA